jgi:hypothetical protein
LKPKNENLKFPFKSFFDAARDFIKKGKTISSENVALLSKKFISDSNFTFLIDYFN